MVRRDCYKCLDCLAVFFTEGTPLAGIRCACGGLASHMGRVRGERVIQTEERCPCDERCTGAQGPNCNCPCGTENHGTGRVVTVETYNGPAPRALNTPSVERRDEFLAALAAAEARILARFGADAVDVRAGRWIADRLTWYQINDTFRALRKARELRSHKGRMKALSEVAVP